MDPFDFLLNPVPVDPADTVLAVDYERLEFGILVALGLTVVDLRSSEDCYGH